MNNGVYQAKCFIPLLRMLSLGNLAMIIVECDSLHGITCALTFVCNIIFPPPTSYNSPSPTVPGITGSGVFLGLCLKKFAQQTTPRLQPPPAPPQPLQPPHLAAAAAAVQRTLKLTKVGLGHCSRVSSRCAANCWIWISATSTVGPTVYR